jgi:hypothetical protein
MNRDAGYADTDAPERPHRAGSWLEDDIGLERHGHW